MLRLAATATALVFFTLDDGHARMWSAAAQNARPDPLAPIAFLVGRWEGTSDGKPGQGRVEREYNRILDSHFIQVRNVTTYPPQQRNQKGERHEDLGVFSFDSGRKRIMLRQFHVEGFVNQDVADPAAAKPNAVAFVSEAIENIPAGYRARETYTLSAAGDLEEVFELAEPGKDFEVYSRSRLKKRP